MALAGEERLLRPSGIGFWAAGGFGTRPYGGWIGAEAACCGLVALAGGSGPRLAPAHGHSVYEVEELFGGDGLRRAELLAAVPADEDGGEGAVLYPEPASRGGGFVRAVLEEGFGQEVAVLAAGLPAFEEVELAGVGLVIGRGGEDEEAAGVRGGVPAQGCPRARSSVCWAAVA